jgi:hypothetical protein
MENDKRTVPQKVIDEIREILEKNDLAGMVLVQDRSNSAFLRRIDPTWSCAWMEPEGPDGKVGVRIRSKLADYGGDKERQRADIEATVGMFISILNWCGETNNNMAQITAMLAKHYPEIMHSEKWTGGGSAWT